MAYLRFSNSEWYVYHSNESGDDIESQMLFILHRDVTFRDISDSINIRTLFSYADLEAYLETGNWIDIPHFTAASEDGRADLIASVKDFMLDAEEQYPSPPLREKIASIISDERALYQRNMERAKESVATDRKYHPERYLAATLQLSWEGNMLNVFISVFICWIFAFLFGLDDFLLGLIIFGISIVVCFALHLGLTLMISMMTIITRYRIFKKVVLRMILKQRRR